MTGTRCRGRQASLRLPYRSPRDEKFIQDAVMHRSSIVSRSRSAGKCQDYGSCSTEPVASSDTQVMQSQSPLKTETGQHFSNLYKVPNSLSFTPTLHFCSQSRRKETMMVERPQRAEVRFAAKSATPARTRHHRSPRYRELFTLVFRSGGKFYPLPCISHDK